MRADDLVARIRRLSPDKRRKLEEMLRSLEDPATDAEAVSPEAASPEATPSPTCPPLAQKAPLRPLRGLLRDLGPAPSEEAIDEARRELWAGFARSAHELAPLRCLPRPDGMSAFRLEIPDDILAQARIGPNELEETLRRELAVQLYSRGLLPKAAARRLSGMERIDFDDLLGSRGIPSELTEEDYEADLRNLAEWRRETGT